jgi:lipoate-protein ligase B
MDRHGGTRIAEYCRAHYLGVVGYVEAQQLQEQLVRARITGDVPDTLLLLQHLPVITMGASAKEDNIVVPRKRLADEGVPTVYSDRGGCVTVHELGQLVGYPILDLSTKGRDLHQYVWNLEQAVIGFLSDYSIVAHRDPDHPGVWVGGYKICAVGIRVSRWVTKHGFALNANNDLKYFSYVHPCGIADRGVTSMSQLLGHDVDLKDVMLGIIEHCSRALGLAIKLESLRVPSAAPC